MRRLPFERVSFARRDPADTGRYGLDFGVRAL